MFTKSLLFCLFFAVAADANYLEYPAVNFPPQVTVDNVCIDLATSTLHTIRPISVCEEISVVQRWACTTVDKEICRVLKNSELPHGMEVLKEQTACTRSGLRNLAVSRDFETTECLRWSTPRNPDQGSPECLAWGQVTKKYPLVYTVKTISEDGERGYRVTSVKNYALPACGTTN